MEALNRYHIAQENTFTTALQEIQNGQKQSHWMWFIFPTIHDRFSPTSFNILYALNSTKEVEAYYKDKILGQRLIIISEALVQHNKSIEDILPKPDIKKLKACMTLFMQIPNADPIFKQVLGKFFDAQQDEKTLEILRSHTT
ncbi:DUF1810 domain-containing protein [Flavobacterium chuncheonense]|uniref:DUF1810 domain-containing protein n=1 Tax=Flavobacterium chuncheonense TaxID=2026653 RepID=A0ABW5YK88_9FLAO